MNTLHSILLSSHVFFGSTALLLFWVPVLTKKGCLDHMKFGRYYGNVMYAVALSGALMALLVIYSPMTIKADLFVNISDSLELVKTLRLYWGFLLFLSLLTYVNVRHGFAVVTYQRSPLCLRKMSYVLPIISLFVAGAVMLFLGLQALNVLYCIFGALGMLAATSMLRYCFFKEPTPKLWLIEHFGAMIGSGIAAYTAFLTFGGRHIFDNLGNLQIIFWLAPGLIGGIVIGLLSRKYNA